MYGRYGYAYDYLEAFDKLLLLLISTELKFCKETMKKPAWQWIGKKKINMHQCAVVQCSRLSWMSWPASSHSNIQSKSSQSLASNFAAIILAYVLKSIRYLSFKLDIQYRI